MKPPPKRGAVGAKTPPKRGTGGKAPSLGYFCAYIDGRRGISTPFILPTQNPGSHPWSPYSLLGGFKGLSHINASCLVVFTLFLGGF